MFFTKKFQNGIFFNNNEKTLKEFKEKKYRYKSIFWKNRKIIEKQIIESKTNVPISRKKKTCSESTKFVIFQQNVN